MNKTLTLLSLIILTTLTSCGYKTTETDKHPEIPVFPKHTNSKINITSFPFLTTDLYFNKKYIFATTENQDLLILDRKFKKIKQEPIIVNLKNITNQGDIYSVNENGDIIKTLKTVHKLSPKNNFKQENLEILKIFSREFLDIRDSLTTHLKGKSKTYIDSIYTIETTNDKQKTLVKLTHAIEGADAMVHLENNEVDILKYQDKDVALYSNLLFFDELNNLKKEKYVKTVQRIIDLEKRPISFDKVVLDNTYSGNHFVGGYTPVGYNYVELTIGSETTKFKAKNANNGDGVHILHTNNDTIILNDDSYKLFYATIKK
ncbi:hypothetical protein [uncultured Formosa sp.]|uniref:hypothetical protein n=1 Tax=uncultured Formosa sp. TaxID=255435 RepID=UPI0026221B86|nr:hypothetical protein [uncultured Formosa sp.]